MTVDFKRDITCCRYKNLVYARTLKAGSEFFYKNFTITAGWTPIKYYEIDWDHDIVFSYIMDPIQRRHKGISEMIISTDTVDLLMGHKGNFHNIVKLIPFLDGHSASLHDIYGENIENIHWILMTNDHQVAIKETEKLLSKHGVPSINWDVDYTHATGSYMSEIYARVKTHWEWTKEPQPDFTVQNYFKKDIELYNKVKEEYNKQNNSEC